MPRPPSMTDAELEALVKRLNAGSSYEELASEIDLKPATLKSRVHRYVNGRRKAVSKPKKAVSKPMSTPEQVAAFETHIDEWLEEGSKQDEVSKPDLSELKNRIDVLEEMLEFQVKERITKLENPTVVEVSKRRQRAIELLEEGSVYTYPQLVKLLGFPTAKHASRFCNRDPLILVDYIIVKGRKTAVVHL